MISKKILNNYFAFFLLYLIHAMKLQNYHENDNYDKYFEIVVIKPESQSFTFDFFKK